VPPPPALNAKNPNTWVNPSCVAKPGGEVKLPPDPAPSSSTKRRQQDDAPPVLPPKRLCGGQELGGWCVGDGFCGVAQLKGHAKAVTGVSTPEVSDKLFSGSMDGTVRVWDCNTGQCVHVAPMQEGEVASLASIDPWVVVGVRGAVKALHTGTGKELRLRGPAASMLVTALLVEDDEHLFAGTEDGVIYMWRMNRSRQSFDEVAAFRGHEKAVASLAQGKGTLYSGSADGSIRAWDLESRRCVCTLAAHAAAATALLCWEQFLLSSSDDGTVKVWRAKPDRDDLDLEVHYVHDEGERVVAIDGTYDPDKKPVLMVSRGDGVVRVYDLQSLQKRGQIHCNGEARAVSLRSPGVVFTGDASGEVRVVKWTPRAEAGV
jgi:WD40 repeat protein